MVVCFALRLSVWAFETVEELSLALLEFKRPTTTNGLFRLVVVDVIVALAGYNTFLVVISGQKTLILEA